MAEYIEREAALNVNFKIPTRFCESKLTTARKAVQEYANEIAKIPAADVRPVVWGRWIDLWIEDEEIISGGYTVPQCSVCKEDSYGTTPYCPNCGADMREKS